MSIIWVGENQPLPLTNDDSNDGLIAAGLDLSPNRLMEAYSKGMFPWFSPGDPVLWWSPNPRMVLNCKDFYISHSLAKNIKKFDQDSEHWHLISDDLANTNDSMELNGSTKSNNSAASSYLSSSNHLSNQKTSHNFIISLNLGFDAVIEACAQRNQNRLSIQQAGKLDELMAAEHQSSANLGRNRTWITTEIQDVYKAWHKLGHVHSVETWLDNKIVGGLYGVSIGKCFFGESMFSRVTDSSKLALAYLVAYLIKQGVEWIDCQQETPHLKSLGARPITREKFLKLLRSNLHQQAPRWGQGRLRANGDLETLNEQTW